MAKILIVEDNPANMALAAFLIGSAGHDLLSATDAQAHGSRAVLHLQDAHNGAGVNPAELERSCEAAVC